MFKINKKKVLLILGASLIFIMIFVGLFAPFISPFSPSDIDLDGQWAPPSPGHPLGQGENGTDVLTHIFYGARVSLFVALVVTSISALLGLFIGCMSGFYGKWVDSIISKAIDITFSFPGILLAIALAAFLGQGVQNVILVLCITGWAGYARVMRGESLRIKSLDYVTSAKALGRPGFLIIIKHIIPNILTPLIVQCSFSISGVIIIESTLSFLGLGVPHGSASWGSLLNSGKSVLTLAPHVSTYAGLAIMLTVLGFNFLGDALRDYLDPKLRKLN